MTSVFMKKPLELLHLLIYVYYLLLCKAVYEKHTPRRKGWRLKPKGEAGELLEDPVLKVVSKSTDQLDKFRMNVLSPASQNNSQTLHHPGFLCSECVQSSEATRSSSLLYTWPTGQQDESNN